MHTRSGLPLGRVTGALAFKGRKHFALLLTVSCLLAACAAPPKPMDRAQYLAATTRMYPGKTKDQVIDAAAKVLSLSDPNGTSTAHNDDGFVAGHKADSLGSREVDTWDFRVRETPEGMRASIQVGTSGTSTYLAPTTTTGTYSVASNSTPSSMVQGDALYDLFWARMDYMLFKGDKWTTCEDQSAKVRTGKVSGPTDALCRMNAPDDQPGKPRVSKLPRRSTGPIEPPPEAVVIAPDRMR